MSVVNLVVEWAGHLVLETAVARAERMDDWTVVVTVVVTDIYWVVSMEI